GGKTSYDADNRPLLVMRSNLWASGYDVDGTDQTSLGQFSGRVQQTYKHSVPRFRSEERFSRNAETDLVCRLRLAKKKTVDICRRVPPAPCLSVRRPPMSTPFPYTTLFRSWR